MATRLIKTARPVARLKAGRNDWYRISAKADAVTAEVHIYDEIGYWGVTAQDFIKDLQGVEATTIELHLNTPGGDVFDGIAIHNALRQHKARVVAYVDSLAASIGSVIAMAGDEVVMARYSTMMIHEASGVAIGANADEMRAMADLLDKTSQNIAQVYADRSGTDIEDWRNLMRAETWFSAEEAVEFGLADRVGDDNRTVENSWDMSIFSYPGRQAAPAPTVAPTGPPSNVFVPAPSTAPPPLVEPQSQPTGVDSPGGGGAAFEFDIDAFRGAMSIAADPPVPTEEAPFEFDPQIFRAIMADRANNAPAIAQYIQEEPKTFEQTFDGEMFAALIREAVS